MKTPTPQSSQIMSVEQMKSSDIKEIKQSFLKEIKTYGENMLEKGKYIDKQFKEYSDLFSLISYMNKCQLPEIDMWVVLRNRYVLIETNP